MGVHLRKARVSSDQPEDTIRLGKVSTGHKPYESEKKVTLTEDYRRNHMKK